MPKLRSGQRLGKYKLRRRIAQGGFGDVFEALDTIEGIAVALKVPLAEGGANVEEFRREIRIAGKLQHPNVLPIKNADLIDGTLAIAYPLGNETLAERLTRRMSTRTALDFGEQALMALAHAHERRVIHCDIKPENFILFPDGALHLTDFGIARLGARTVAASGAGSLGFMAPEQAMGRPSARSDVFSAGLVIWRMLAGKVPVWPFEWPPPGADRLRRKAPAMTPVLQRALQFHSRKRFRDAAGFLEAYTRAKRDTLRREVRRRRSAS